MNPLETKRLILRPFRGTDAKAFSAYRSDPVVARYQGWTAPFGLSKAKGFIAKMKRAKPAKGSDWYQIAIESKPDGGLIGDCAFHLLAEDPKQAEIAFTLSRARQGSGNAAEAVARLLDYLFGDLKLHRVKATCDAQNAGAQALLERVGMRQEGRFVENVWFKGRWSTEYSYAMLDREWAGRRKP